MYDVNFSRTIETMENNEPGVNQYKVGAIDIEPSIGYKKYNFSVFMQFESFEQYEQTVEEGTFFSQLTSCYECSSFKLDDKKLILRFNCQVVW